MAIKIAFSLLLCSAAAWAKMQTIDFSSHDGLNLRARLHQPPPTFSQKKLPGVLIVEGSGKSSFQEEPELSPFRQLASQLADQGFVTLSFNKRGSADNASNGSFWKSTFKTDNDDAQAALDFLKAQPNVNPDKIFVIGHSFGGPHALKLARQNSLAGIIMLTSTIRSVSDLQLEQTRVISELSGLNQVQIDAEIKKLSQQIQDVKANTFVCTSPSCEMIEETPVVDKSIQVPWWSEVLKLDFTEWAIRTTTPILFVFGTSDFVIPETDYHYVQDVVRLHKTSHIETRLLKRLDHFMMENDSRKASFDYIRQAQKDQKFKTISSALVQEITTWMKPPQAPQKQAVRTKRTKKRI